MGICLNDIGLNSLNPKLERNNKTITIQFDFSLKNKNLANIYLAECYVYDSNNKRIDGVNSKKKLDRN